MPIGGGKNYPTSPAARERWIADHSTHLEAAAVERLLERYGTRATDVIAYVIQDAGRPLSSDPAITTSEISYFVEHEHAVHLVDVVLRRTNIAFVGGVTIELLTEIASLLAAKLGWTLEEVDREIEQTLAELEKSHGVTIGSQLVPERRAQG